VLDTRDVADRSVPVERDERDRDRLTPALAPQLAAPEIEPLVVVGPTVLRAVPTRKPLDMLRMTREQLDRDRNGSEDRLPAWAFA
jgi:hypothetical protein